MTGDSLLTSLTAFAHRHRLIEEGDAIIIALSGGVDSMVLLDILKRTAETTKLQLAAAHVNYGLRGAESDADEDFVRVEAAKRDIPCHIDRAKNALIKRRQGQSIQMAARELRYAFFSRLRAELNYTKIATAHQANDHAETMLLQLFRGSGIRALAGIDVHRKDQHIIRPLLFAPKEELFAYAKRNGIDYRTDSTNAVPAYTRNALRINVIPEIESRINPGLLGTLTRTGEIFRRLQSYVESEAVKAREAVVESAQADSIIIRRSAFFCLPEFMRSHLLSQFIQELAEHEVEFSTIESLMDVASAPTGRYRSLGGSLVFYRDRERLVFQRLEFENGFEYVVDTEAWNAFGDFGFGASRVDRPEYSADRNIEFVDGALLHRPLVLRSMKPGDWFMPLGLGKKKKISDLLTENKVPRFAKNTIPILESKGSIVWVCGIRLDDRFKVTDSTTNIVKLEYRDMTAAE